MEFIKNLPENGDFIDSIKSWTTQGLTYTYLASLFNCRARNIINACKYGNPPKWMLGVYAQLKERLDQEASDSGTADMRDYITRLAHYSAAVERVKSNWRFPFRGFPQPEQRHFADAEAVAKAGGIPALSLELLKCDFYIKRIASWKMFRAKYRIRDFNIPNWCGLWGWLDLWNDALNNSKGGRMFLFNHAELTQKYLNRKKEVIKDARNDIFSRIDKLRAESANDRGKQEATVPEYLYERKSHCVSKALKSGRCKVPMYKLDYNTKA